eukprot:scaffold80953_cov41-Phaeocystis_antarctica.AAC.2
MTNDVRTHDLGVRRMLLVGAARPHCCTVRAPPADRRGRGSRALDAPALDSAPLLLVATAGLGRWLARRAQRSRVLRVPRPVAVRCRLNATHSKLSPGSLLLSLPPVGVVAQSTASRPS